METAGHNLEVENLASPICFETKRIKKWSAKLVALGFFLVAFAISALLVSCCFVIGPFPLPFALLVVGTTLMLLFFAFVFRRRVLPGLQFCVIFRSECLQLGRAFSKQLFQYDEIDRIHATPDAGIRVGCGKSTATVFLDGRGKQDCVTLLRDYCPNAYFVDERGREHFPIAPTCPERTLAGVEHHHRARAWGYVILSCGIAWCVLRLWVLGWNLLIFGVLALLLVCACLGVAWRSWRIAKLARRKRIEASATRSLAGDADNFGISNDNRDSIADPPQ
jgi:hypothetical protein